jgi:hypothetical protein
MDVYSEAMNALVDRDVMSGENHWFHQLPYAEQLQIDREELGHRRGDR